MEYCVKRAYAVWLTFSGSDLCLGSESAAFSSVTQVAMSFSVRGESIGAQWNGMTFFRRPASEFLFWILSWAMFLLDVTISSSASHESSMAPPSSSVSLSSVAPPEKIMSLAAVANSFFFSVLLISTVVCVCVPYGDILGVRRIK